MPQPRYPAADPALLALKQSATAGTGRGALYDRGVLAVVEQVERSGYFLPDPITLVDLVQFSLACGAGVATPREIARAEQMARQRGWEWAEAAQYAAGVRHAEDSLSAYRSRDRDDPCTLEMET